jgi:shikimate kinase/RimJ/RimL family protein N-acetyltransferase
VYLETDRLLLRRFMESDVDNLVELDGDPRVMRYLNGGKPTPREKIRNKILPGILRDYDRVAGYGTWAAVEKATGRFLGWFELRAPEGGRGAEAELGYRLRVSAWGKGYATEGARALIDKGFTELGLRRIYAETMAVNTASRRVLRKAGLRLVRTFYPNWKDPIDGAEHGEVEYELLRADWSRYPPPMTSRGPVLILVGPPGSGKTTVGRALADALGVAFRDTDTDVEQTVGKPISAIFTEDGEPVFRVEEERAVRTALDEHPGVLALGGGAVLSDRTRRLLAAHPVAFLNVGMAEGVRRTGLSTARPLLAGVNPRARFKELLEARLPLYREVATVEVVTDDRSPEQVAREVLDALGLVGTP